MCLEDEKGGSGEGREGSVRTCGRKELSSTNINGMVRKRGCQVTSGYLPKV